jgi:peroxiredoxin
MSLGEQLAAIRAVRAKHISEDERAIMGRATHQLRQSGILDNTIKVGDRLPPFALQNTDGVETRSADLLDEGALVLSICQGHWSPYCTAELAALCEIVEPLTQAGVRLVAITPQLAEHSRVLTETYGVNFDILSDPGNAYAAELGLRFAVVDAVRRIYLDLGTDLVATNGDDSWTLPVPARLVVDSSGIVRAADIDPNYTQRPEPQKTLDDVKALVGG